MDVSSAALAYGKLAEARSEIMLLGTYHLANNNRDLINLRIEDVLTAARQEQLEMLVHGLAAWKPTRLAVEWPRSDQAGLSERFAAYLADDLRVTAHEIDQIAFRLARRMSLSTLHAIDWNGSPPGDASSYDFVEWARRNDRSRRFDELVSKEQAEADALAFSMRAQTICQWHCDVNSPEQRLRMHKPYFSIASLGEDADNPGAAWVGGWYARNLRILNNLAEIIGSSERVLVIYGTGHMHLLAQFIEDSELARLVDPRDYIPACA